MSSQETTVNIENKKQKRQKIVKACNDCRRRKVSNKLYEKVNEFLNKRILRSSVTVGNLVVHVEDQLYLVYLNLLHLNEELQSITSSLWRTELMSLKEH